MSDIHKQMPSSAQQKLPLDARLLAEAVIELNASRRSVSLYPVEHPIVRDAIERALLKFNKLFEIRDEIVLGVSEETLSVDEYTLDRKSPLFAEFAESLHGSGIASLTFKSGLSQSELISLNELLTLKELPQGRTVADLAAERNMEHVVLTMIDFSKFAFFEHAQRGDDQGRIWEDYIYGFLQGSLGGEGDEGIFLASPEEVAEALNKVMPDGASAESHDRIIRAYLFRKDQSDFSSAALRRFFSLAQGLRPALRQKLLARLSTFLETNLAGIEKALSEMTQEEFGMVVDLLTRNVHRIPETLKKLISRLSTANKQERKTFDFYYQKSAVLHDIEIGGDMLKLFGDDSFHTYAGEEYQQQLERMLASLSVDSTRQEELRAECSEEILDRVHLNILLELLEADFVTYDDYLAMVTKLTEMVTAFLETGRFEEVLEAYNALKSHGLTHKFSEAARSALEYFFYAPGTVGRFLEAIRIWGRKDRDATIRLVKALRQQLMEPLLTQLAEEDDAVLRKFYLSILTALGTDLHSHILGRLGDDRWYVVRNMLYLVRDSNCKAALDQVRKLTKHDNPQLCAEAVRTLLHFRTGDALPHLKSLLTHADPDIRMRAVRIAGAAQVREAVPILTRMLGEKDLLGTGTSVKADVVRSLADIGDPGAIPSLVKLFKSRTIFNRRHLEDLKLEIFKNLEGYQPDAVQPLIELGLAAKNPAVRELSRQYQARFRGERGQR